MSDVTTQKLTGWPATRCSKSTFTEQGPMVWKWSATHFEPTMPEALLAIDVGKVAATTASRPHPWEFDNVGGWSTRKFGQTIPKYQLVLKGHPVTIQFLGETRPP